MKKRVRKVQRFSIMEKMTGALRNVVVRHDTVRPVKQPVIERVAAYTAQNGGDWLTPRQARRLRLKGQATSTPVRGRAPGAGVPTLVRSGLDWDPSTDR
jgi:hypothetical protein